MSAIKLHNPWWVAGGATIGLIAGNGAIVLFTFGVLLTPIMAEFGWERGTAGVAMFFAHVTAALATPFVGILIDRYGIRRVSLSFITLFSLSMAAISLTPASPAMFFLLYAIAGLFSAGQTPMPYAKAVAASFDAKRGLALGVAMAGVGIGTSLMPPWTQYLIDTYGWREAYIGLGLTTFFFAFPAVAFFVGQADTKLLARREADHTEIPGIGAHDAIHTYRFWAIGIAALLFTIAVTGTISHVVPLLQDRGIDAQVAAAMMVASGLSTIAGRLISGYLLDRFFAPYVAAAFFTLPIIGIAILASGLGGYAPLLAIICLGLGLGAEVDLIGFLVSRYFGLKAFGEIYGYVFAMFALGSGSGHMILGYAFDRTGSYLAGDVVSGVFVVIAAILLWRLGPYTFPAKH